MKYFTRDYWLSLQRGYQTRHTYASMMLMAGENPLWVARQMGHADASITLKRYARWIPSDMPDAGSKATAVWSQFGHNETVSDSKENAWGGNRTRTPLAGLRILSPVRLPVPPPRLNACNYLIRKIILHFETLTSSELHRSVKQKLWMLRWRNSATAPAMYAGLKCRSGSIGNSQGGRLLSVSGRICQR
jgi:hypothetical protein